jgi:hypothetical protein
MLDLCDDHSFVRGIAISTRAGKVKLKVSNDFSAASHVFELMSCLFFKCLTGKDGHGRTTFNQ